MMEKIKITAGEMCFYIFWISLLAAKGLGLYDGQKIFQILFLTAAAGFAGKLLLTKHNLIEWLIIAGSLGIVWFSYRQSGEKGLLMYTMLLLGMKNIPLKRMFKIGAAVWGSAFFLTTLYSLFHMADTVYKIHPKLGLSHILRWSLGYPHPNVLHVSFAVLAMFIVYLMGKQYNKKSYVGLMAVNFVIFFYSVSYTGFIAASLYLTAALYFRYRKTFRLPEKAAVMAVLPFCIFASLILPLMAQGELFAFLNRFTNTRFVLASQFLVPENLSLLGIRTSDIVTAIMTMDNAYVNALITYGIIPFTLLMVLFIALSRRLCKQRRTAEIAIMISTFAAGITEPFLFNSGFKNLTFLFAGEMLYELTGQLHASMENGVRQNCGLKEMGILSRFDRTWELSGIKMAAVCRKTRTSLHKNKFRIAAAAASGALAGAALFCVTYESPVSIVAPRVHCSDTDETSIYLTGEDDANYRGSLILGYQNEQTRMQEFSGNILIAEQIRGIFSGAYAGAVFAGGIFITLLYLTALHKKLRNRSYKKL